MTLNKNSVYSKRRIVNDFYIWMDLNAYNYDEAADRVLEYISGIEKSNLNIEDKNKIRHILFQI